MNREDLLARQANGETLTQEEEAFLASTPESIQPTPTPAATPIDQGRYIGVLEQTLREQNQQIQTLMSGLAARTTEPAAPAGPSKEEEKQSFYNDPVTTTERIVTNALAKAIEPLNQFVRGLKIDGSPYANMLGKFKADVRFTQVLSDPDVLATVEKIMEKAELSEVNMQSAIVHASGLKSMGLLGTIITPSSSSTPAPVSNGNGNPPAPSVVLPPHVRPSAAPVPRGQDGDQPIKRPPMTENMRRVMREQGFKTEKEYWEWMDMDAAEVAKSKFGQPAPAGGAK